MEIALAAGPANRYTELRKRVDALEKRDPVAAVSPEEAESLRQVIETLEAIDRLVARQSDR